MSVVHQPLSTYVVRGRSATGRASVIKLSEDAVNRSQPLVASATLVALVFALAPVANADPSPLRPPTRATGTLLPDQLALRPQLELLPSIDAFPSTSEGSFGQLTPLAEKTEDTTLFLVLVTVGGALTLGGLLVDPASENQENLQAGAVTVGVLCLLVAGYMLEGLL